MTHKENIAFWLLVSLFLLPLWIFPYVPLQDGPSHLAGANILKEYNETDASLFRKFYLISPELVPNWSGHIVLALLLHVISPDMAEKLLLSGYIILFPVAFRYLLRGINPENSNLAFLSFPFIYNYLFHMGFFNFVWSLVILFVVLGFWIRIRENFSAWKVLVFSLLVLVLYFTHIFTFTTSAIMLACMEIGWAFYTVRCVSKPAKFNVPKVFREVGIKAFLGILAFLPAAVLAVLFMSQRKTMPLPESPQIYDAFNMFLSLYSLVSFEWNEIWVARIIASCLFLLGGWHFLYKMKTKTFQRFDGFLLVTLVFVMFYFVTPNTLLVSQNEMSGGGFIKDRIGMLPFLSLIIWMGAQRPLRGGSRIVVGVVVACSLILLYMHVQKYHELSEFFEEYESVVQIIPADTVVLPLSFFKYGPEQATEPLSWKVDPFRHFSEKSMAQKHVVVWSHYEGNMGYFPTLFRPNFNPFAVLGKMPWNLENLDLIELGKKDIGYPDLILLWMPPRKGSKSWKQFPVLQQIDQRYDLIFQSIPHGYALLYRKKEEGLKGGMKVVSQKPSKILFNK